MTVGGNGVPCLQVWDLLVWSDGQSRAPVAVVAKMHYFAKLDITQTVKNFASHCPRFWSSPEFRDTLEGSNILALGTTIFGQVSDVVSRPSILTRHLHLFYCLPKLRHRRHIHPVQSRPGNSSQVIGYMPHDQKLVEQYAHHFTDQQLKMCC